MSTVIEPNPPSVCHGRLADRAATEALAGRIADCLVPGFVLHLSGGLGVGKTTFTRALLAALGHRGRVKSPTFALLEPYNLSKFELHHYDFYRLESPEAWRDAGFESSFDGRTVVVIEWPEQAGNSLPAPDLHLRLGLVGAAPDPTPAPARQHALADTEGPAERRPAPHSSTDTAGELAAEERRFWLEATSDRGRACLSRLTAGGCCVKGR
jgi:tRNA threonylcarbamoyladenosine biosynthesis protein TsaE